MSQSLNILLVLAITAFAAWQYSKDYHEGLMLVIFLLLALPDALEVQLSVSIPSFTVHRCLLLVTTIAWATNPDLHKSLRGVPFAGIFLSITIAYVLSTLLSENFLVSTKRLFYYATESFLFFMIIQTSVTSDATARRIIRVAGFALLSVAAFSYIERYASLRVYQLIPRYRQDYGFEALSGSIGGGGLGGKCLSTYNHPILFGVACAVCLCYFLIVMNPSGNKSRDLFHWGASFIAGGALYFSNSRGPWISFVATMLLLCLLFPSRFVKRALILASLALLVMVIRPGTYETIHGLSQATLDKSTVQGSSFQWRFAVFNMATTKIAQADIFHSLFGFGGGSHIFLNFGDIELSTGHVVTMESWDSELCVNLFEQGVIGMGLILLLHAVFFTRTVRHLMTYRPQNDAVLFAIACISVLLLSQLTVRMFSPQLIYLESIGFALSSRYLQEYGILSSSS